MAAKTWKFTLNNWTPKDRELFENLDCNVIVFGEEVAPSTGTPHLQGHITFKRTYRLGALKKICNCHWEVAKCSDFNYELKGENVFIKDLREQGKRNDLDEVIEKIDSGCSIEEVAKAYPKSYIKYHSGLGKLIAIKNSIKTTSMYSLVDCSRNIGLAPFTFGVSRILVGESGCGKTQFALAHFDNPLLVSHIDDLKSLNGGHDGIVFDDVDFTHYPRTAQIHLVDWEQTRSIHCRYGNATIPMHTCKIFTCNYDCLPVNINEEAINRRLIVTTCDRDRSYGKGNTVLFRNRSSKLGFGAEEHVASRRSAFEEAEMKFDWECQEMLGI